MSAFRIRLRIVLEPERNGIETERGGQFIHRRLETKGAGRLARSAVERRRAEIEPDKPLAGVDVRARVENSRLKRRRLDPVFEDRRARGHILTDRRQAPVFARRHRKMLDGVGPRADGSKHLPAAEHELDRPFDVPRRHRRKHDVRPRRALRPEPAADELRDNSHLLGRYAERLRHEPLDAVHVLRRVVQREAVRWFPDRDGGVRLHRIVRFERRRVDRLDDGVGLGQAGGHIAAMAGRLEHAENLLRVRLGRRQLLLHVDGGRLGAVGRLDQRRRMCRLLERLGDDDRDRLAVVSDFAALQKRERAAGRRIERGVALLREASARCRR